MYTGETKQVLIPGATRICLVMCISAKGFKNASFERTALKRHLLESFKDTAENKYLYSLIIGIDHDDKYWHQHRKTILTSFTPLENIDVELIYVDGGSFTKAINAVASYAHAQREERECNYYARVNDDSEFVSKNWTSMAVKQLQKFKPENLGVVGPTVPQGNSAILVFDFVHRTHLDIFETYYPSQLNNWWADDWITNVYKPHNYAKLKKWKMNHVMIHGRRYSVNFKEKQYLKGLVDKGRTLIRSHSKI
jgi:hypothetical protein